MYMTVQYIEEVYTLWEKCLKPYIPYIHDLDNLETFPKSLKLLATFEDADFRQPIYNVWLLPK